MKSLQFWMVALALCCVCSVVEAGAAATVTVTQTSEGVYSVAVADVKKSALLDFTILYDVETLSNPVVSDGLFATAVGATQIPNNDSKRGALRVVYVTTAKDAFFEGSGQLATVRFIKTGTMQSRPPGLKSEIISLAGAQTAVQSIVATSVGTAAGTIPSGSNSGVSTANQTNQTNQTNQNSGNMGSLPSRPSVQTATASGTVTYQPLLSGTGQENKSPRADSPPVDSQEAPLQQSQQGISAVVQDTVSPAITETANRTVLNTTVDTTLKNLKSLESVAERFRTYKGARTLKGLSELFDGSRSKASGVVQTPKIAVSDGKKMITVKVSLPADSGVPSFSLKGANLKGIRSLSEGSLELDAVPQKGKLDVRLTIVMQKDAAEVPLLVVPPVSGDILGLSELAIEKLLSRSDAKNQSLPYDLNADGKQDFLDDYILVGHWLLRQQSDKKVPAAKAQVPR